MYFSDKKTRKRKSQGKEKEAPAVQWPPKRQHHKPPPKPTDQLRFSNSNED